MEGGLLCVISKNQIFFIVRIFFTTVSLYIFIYLFDLLALKKKKNNYYFYYSCCHFFFCIRYVNHHWYSFSYNTDNNTVIVAVCPTATLTQDRRSTSLAVTSAPLSIKTLAASVPPFSAAKKRGVRQSLSRGSTKAP